MLRWGTTHMANTVWIGPTSAARARLGRGDRSPSVELLRIRGV